MYMRVTRLRSGGSAKPQTLTEIVKMEFKKKKKKTAHITQSCFREINYLFSPINIYDFSEWFEFEYVTIGKFP